MYVCINENRVYTCILPKTKYICTSLIHEQINEKGYNEKRTYKFCDKFLFF